MPMTIAQSLSDSRASYLFSDTVVTGEIETVSVKVICNRDLRVLQRHFLTARTSETSLWQTRQ